MACGGAVGDGVSGRFRSSATSSEPPTAGMASTSRPSRPNQVRSGRFGETADSISSPIKATTTRDVGGNQQGDRDGLERHSIGSPRSLRVG